MLRHRWAVLALAVFVGTGARPALAADTGEAATTLARDRFKQGAEAYAGGRYKDAIDLFLDANRLAPNPAFAYNIGLAYQELGDAPNALRWYRDYLRALPGAADRPEIEARIDDAEKRLRERGVQQVTILSTPEGATLAVDGLKLGVTPWSGELAPGHHRLTLELRGYRDETTAFELPSDHAVDVGTKLHAQGERVPAAPPPPPGEARLEVRADEPSGRSRVGPLTWTTLSIGAAGLGAALGFEFARSGAVDSARAGTNLEGKDQYDRATSFQTMARVSLGVGAAFAAAGGVLLYIDLSSSPAPGPKTGAAVGCRGALCGVTFHGAF